MVGVGGIILTRQNLQGEADPNESDDEDEQRGREQGGAAM